MGKLGFYFDSTLCIGCRTCQVACKDKNGLPAGISYRVVRSFATGDYPRPGFYHYSGACNHCFSPACVASCPVGAMHIDEDDGTVQYDEETCIGCKACVAACPYGEPQYFEEENVVRKCDACKDVRDQGGNPVCVDACLMRCLEFGDVDELQKIHGDSVVDELPILPSADQTAPSLRINPRPAALESAFAEKFV